MKLIRKGGFRERANRQSRYEDSENKQQQLKPHHYEHSKPNVLYLASSDTKNPQAAEQSPSSHELKDCNHINKKPYGK